MELEKPMEVSANPISSANQKGRKAKIRVAWTRFGVIIAGVGVAFFIFGMLRIDGVMSAMGLSMLLLLGFVRFLGVWNIQGISLAYSGPRRVEVARGFDAKLEMHGGKRLLDAFLIEFGVGLLGESCMVGIWRSSDYEAVVEFETSWAESSTERLDKIEFSDGVI
jgi:hypothetical protein